MSRYIDADALIADMQERYCKPCKERKEDYNEVRCRACWVDDAMDEVDGFGDNGIDIVRCKECRWYDPPHILHKDGTRTDVDEGSPWVTVDVGINCDGQCIHHIDLKTYCVNHDRENPDDNERIVIFRSPDDFCSYGEREGE